MRTVIASNVFFSVSTSILSVLLCTVILVVRDAETWFNVHMAVLAPIIACLCYGDSLIKIFRMAIVNITGVICGGLLGFLWIVILRIVSDSISGSLSYNAYYATLLSIPWLILFKSSAPTKIVSQTCLTLVFLSITMYSGDFDSPDAFPLRAILAGVIGCLIPCIIGSLLAVILNKIDHKDRLIGFDPAPYETSLSSYFDAIIDELIRPSPTRSLIDSKKDQCLRSIYLETSSVKIITLPVREAMFACFSDILVLDEISRVGPPQLSHELLSELISLKSSHRTPLLAPSESVKIAFPHITSYFSHFAEYIVIRETMKVANFTSFFCAFVAEYELNDSPLLLPIWTAIRDPKSRTHALVDLVRFSCVFAALGLLLVLWDARDQTVDTYALWSFLPAFILYTRIDSVGSALVDGGTHLAATIVGGGLGLFCLLLNDSTNPMSSLTEFTITLLLGFVAEHHISPRYGQLGVVFTVTWIECVLGNLGHDPSESSDNLNSIWRVALYRMIIPCFAVFVVALSFLILPPGRQSSKLKSFTLHLLQDEITDKDLTQVVQRYKHEKLCLKAEFNSTISAKFHDLITLCSLGRVVQSESFAPEQDETLSVMRELSSIRKIGMVQAICSTQIVSKTRLLKQWLSQALRRPEKHEIVQAAILVRYMQTWLRVARTVFEHELDQDTSGTTTRFNSNIEDQTV